MTFRNGHENHDDWNRTVSDDPIETGDYATSATVQGTAARDPHREGLNTAETKRMIEQLIGHLTALGILQAQRIAREAAQSKNPKEYLERERNRAIEVMRAAMVTAPGLDSDTIRNKALAVVTQTFESIRIQDPTGEAAPIDLASNRTVN